MNKKRKYIVQLGYEENGKTKIVNKFEKVKFLKLLEDHINIKYDKIRRSEERFLGDSKQRDNIRKLGNIFLNFGRIDRFRISNDKFKTTITWMTTLERYSSRAIAFGITFSDICRKVHQLCEKRRYEKK